MASSHARGLRRFVHAFNGFLLLLSSVSASSAWGQTSVVPEHTLAIGNLGSITCNPRRYAFNPTWTLLAAPQDDGSVRLFDVATGTALAPLRGGWKVGTFTYSQSDQGPPAYFGFSTDGEQLVWTWGKKVVLWDVASRQVRRREEIAGSSWGFDFSLFGGGGLVEKVRTAWPEPPSTGAGSRADSGDGRLVAFVNDNGDVAIQDGSNTRVLPGREKGKRGGCTVFDHGRRGPQLLFSRDARILCDSCLVTDVWDLSEAVPRLIVRTGRLSDTAGSPVLSPDGRTLAYTAAMGADGGFGLVDVENARSIGPMVEVKYMGPMEFSPDGRRLATVGWVPRKGKKRDFEVQIWSVEALRSAAPR